MVHKKSAADTSEIFYSLEFLGVLIIVSNVHLRKIFHNDSSPRFKFLLSNERLD